MTRKQSTDTILMVRPADFRKNEETAVNNYFQSEQRSTDYTQTLALAEFDELVYKLRANDIKVIIVQDEGKWDTPDSIFPNNVISFHGHTAIIYPMFAPNRRVERQLNYLGILSNNGIFFQKLLDYTSFEEAELFLESTGAFVLDRLNKVAYCSLSPRADLEVLQVFCEDLGYRSVVFEGTQIFQGQTLPIYHTNVLMSIGTAFSVVCFDALRDAKQVEKLKAELEKSNREIIEISEDQMNRFCGNILELSRHDSTGKIIVMSEQAHKAFTAEQLSSIQKFGTIVNSPVYTVEKFGGGSVRCMIAEVFYD